MRKEHARQIIVSHSSLSEYEFDGDDADRYYLPARGLADAQSFARMGKIPIVIIPKHESLRALVNFYQQTLNNGMSIELIETPDSHYLMDQDIFDSQDLLNELLQRSKEKDTSLYPYGVTKEFMTWARLLIEVGVAVIGDKKRYLDCKWWGHKGGLHRWIDTLSAPSFADLAGIPTAPGYVARDKEEIVRACELLQTWNVMLKPYILSGGFEMKACHRPDDIVSYAIPLMPRTIDPAEGPMPIVVEKLLDIDRDSQGEMIYSAQFTGRQQIGQLTRQIIHGGVHWSGNVLPSGAPRSFEMRAKRIVDAFLRYARPRGPGGVDIASVEGTPVILEINGGRPTGAHGPIMFKRAFSPLSPAVIFEKEDRPQMLTADVESVWDRLMNAEYHERSLAFDKETGKGVYPLIWLQRSWAMLVACSESSEQSRALLEEAKNIIYT